MIHYQQGCLTQLLCLKNIELLLDDVTAFADSEDNYYISIGIMRCTSGNRFFKTIINQPSKSIEDYQFVNRSCLK